MLKDNTARGMNARCRRLVILSLVAGLQLGARSAIAQFTVFEGNGVDPASITAVRDAFRGAIGGGTVAGADGSFGGVRREINWDGVPASLSDPNLLPADFFNTASPRGVVFSTPGTGFMVSANAGGAQSTLFGFPNDFQTFSPQKLFTAINSNITDVTFYDPGTATPSFTTAFGLIFVDAEVAGSTNVEFFDPANTLIFSRDALIGGNQSLTFLGAIANSGDHIGRVRITSGSNTIVANGQLGNPNDDVVVMDDFIFAEPIGPAAVPEPGTFALLAGLVAPGAILLRRRRA